MIKEQTHLEPSISTYKRKHHFHLKWEYIAVPIMAMLGVGLIMVVAGLADSKEATPIRISEVCPHNFNLAADCSGNCSDYIELRNESNAEVNLSDYYLSDDEHDPTKFRLPDIKLGAGECIIVWADGTEVTCECANEIHANFRLSDGEVAVLTSKNMDIIDFVSLFDFPDNVSATKLDGQFVKAYGTPGVNNDDCKLYQPAALDMPIFSLSSGFYPTDSITLEINVPEGVTVYYTTDGSIPDETSNVYSEALILTDVSCEPNRYVNIRNTVPDYDNNEVNNEPVNKANVIRAIAIDDRGNFSKVKTATYFVGEIAKEYEGFAILSVVSDPKDLFGDDGICVTGRAYDEWYNNTDRSTEAPVANFLQHGRQWERRATVQFWDENRNLVLDQDCGMRIQGNSYRSYGTKRFSFYARDYYSGNDLFNAPIFPSGQLSHSFYTRSDDADMIAQELIANRELAMQEGIPTVCFLDGEFYVVTYIRERHDSTYFSENYGIPEEDIVVITCGEVDEGTAEDLNEYQELIDFLTNADMTDRAVYAELEARLDVQNFIDFMVANLYCNNYDIATNHNFKMWRSRTNGGEGYRDGKWRMASYDMDAIAWAYYYRTDSSLEECNPFKYTFADTEKYGEGSKNLIYIPFFQNLLKNPTFRDRFITTYLDMMNTNFSMDSYGGEILAKYGDIQSWLWPVLLTERHKYTIEHLKYAFDLTGSECDVTIETTEGGTVQVNTTTAYSPDNNWTATYISGLEMTFTAVAEDDWQFVGWQGDLSSSEQSISVDLGEEGLYLKAVFAREGSE